MSDAEEPPPSTGPVPDAPGEVDARALVARDERYEFHRHVMTQLQDAIRLADAKVSLLLVILGAALPVMVEKWQDALELWRGGLPAGWAVLLLTFASMVYAVSMGYAIAVFTPRLPSTLTRGLIFFLDIRGHASVDEYLAAARAAGPEELLESLLRQNWVLSAIAARKFRYTAYAITASVVWLLLAVGCVLLVPKA